MAQRKKLTEAEKLKRKVYRGVPIFEMTVEMLVIASEHEQYPLHLLSKKAKELLPKGNELNDVLAKINEWEDNNNVGSWFKSGGTVGR